MYEVIPMYYSNLRMWSKYDKFLLQFSIHIPTRYIKNEKSQIRFMIKSDNKMKIQKYKKKFENVKRVKRYNKRCCK